MCVGCRQMSPKRELIRIVKSPEGVLSVDLKGKAPGRGAYICKSSECLEKALKQKQLERALEAKIGDDIALRLREEVETACRTL
ncbi:MAG: YlxR family protein [Eubacteriales bacterium]|nr:YlxR family protein [Eubacteriales bacterium]MDD3882300.1 YlxR family protein [Eubacteriales bacterium]MDD4512046.1 YlxR family protein [Eubacteriales bacterium]